MGDAAAMPEGWVLQQQNRPVILVSSMKPHALLSVDAVHTTVEGFSRGKGSVVGLHGFPERESTSATPLLDAIDDMNARYNAAYPNP